LKTENREEITIERYPFTICFIKRGNEILLLNREKPAWMGIWNGIGGKLGSDEDPEQGVIREVYEETGIQLEKVSYKGVVTWTVDQEHTGGMYLYLAELPEDFSYETPRKTPEGILDWKEISWILHPKNVGVASNIPMFLNKVLEEDKIYNHQCVYEIGLLQNYHAIPLLSES
jgi:8-oxo-dGTP diphosphatase